MRLHIVLHLVILLKSIVNVSSECKIEQSTTARCNNWTFSDDLNIVGNITELQLDNVQGQIEDGYFSTRSHIQKLVISSGEQLAVKEGSFKGLYNLKHLQLTNTNIERIPEYSLVYLSKLETLDWSNNQIHSVDVDTFRYNTQLQLLDLSDNPLKRLDALTLHGLTNLHLLLLNNCRLQSFDLEIVQDLNELHGINISHNVLTSINPAAINNATHSSSLSWIDLSGNRLTDVSALSSSIFHSLRWLDFSNNKLLRLSTLPQSVIELQLSNNSFVVANNTALPLPGDLQRLQLSHCDNLTRIDRNFFTSSPHVHSVNISNNRHLSVIEHAAFDPLNNLTQLDISFNQLVWLPRSLRQLSSSADLRLTRNNLSCDCSVVWLRERATLSATNRLQCWWRGNKLSLTSISDTDKVQCPAASITVQQRHVWVDYNSTVVLSCHMTPAVEHLTWITPEKFALHWHRDSDNTPRPHHPDRHTARMLVHDPRLLDYRVLHDGQLEVHATRHAQRGRHVCIGENAVSIATGAVLLTIGVGSLHDIKMTTMLLALIGCVAAISFALIVRLALFIFYQCGCCPCCRDEPPPRTKRLKKVLDSVEQWRAQQLIGLRENYAQQVAGIKDSCYQQVGRIRETYKGQVRCLGDMRDYGAQQIDGLREQYLDQVKRVREYSLSQMNRVHENYIFQRNRIRKYSGHQLVRLRETAKYQQRALNKLMETLPELYLQNCRNGGGGGEQDQDNDLFPWYDYESPQHVATDSSQQWEGQSRADARLDTVVVIEMENRSVYYHRSGTEGEGGEVDVDVDESLDVALTLEEPPELESASEGEDNTNDQRADSSKIAAERELLVVKDAVSQNNHINSLGDCSADNEDPKSKKDDTPERSMPSEASEQQNGDSDIPNGDDSASPTNHETNGKDHSNIEEISDSQSVITNQYKSSHPSLVHNTDHDELDKQSEIPILGTGSANNLPIDTSPSISNQSVQSSGVDKSSGGVITTNPPTLSEKKEDLEVITVTKHGDESPERHTVNL